MEAIEIGKTYKSRRQSYTVEKIEAGKVHVNMGGGTRLAYEIDQFRRQIMASPWRRK